MPGYLERADIEVQVRRDGRQLLRQGRASHPRGRCTFVAMKILVPTKRVPDTDQKIVASDDGSRVSSRPHSVRHQSVRCDRAGRGGAHQRAARPTAEVVAVGIGEAGYEQQLRTALGDGRRAGDSRRLRAQTLDPWNVARLLRAVVEREQPQLVLMGKQAVDDDANQTGQFLAALLDWPQATFASRVELARRRDYASIAKPTTASKRFACRCRRSSPSTCGSTNRATHRWPAS